MITINYISKHKCSKNSFSIEKYYIDYKIYSLKVSKNERGISANIKIKKKLLMFIFRSDITVALIIHLI